MEPARVDSIQVLRDVKAALAKFAEAANVALSDAESEMTRLRNWLEHEQAVFWQNQIRKRAEVLGRAKEALRMKKLFRDASGRTPSAVDEEKAASRAKTALDEAEQKLLLTKKWAQRLAKEIQLYKGTVQRFATTVQSDVPVGMAKLEAWARALDAYVALNGPAVSVPSAGREPASGPAGGAGAMARAADQATSDPDFPQFNAPAVAVLHLDGVSGGVVTADGKPHPGEGGKYLVIDSVESGLAYARRRAEENPSLLLLVYDHEGRVIPQEL